MFNSRAICSSCASQVRQAQARCQAGAVLFSSLSEATSSGSAPAQHRHESRKARDDKIEAGRGNRQAFLHRRRQRLPNNSSGESAIAMFNDVVNPGSDTRSRPHFEIPSPAEWEIEKNIKMLLERESSAAQKLKSFRHDVWPHLQRHARLCSLRSTAEFFDKISDEIVDSGSTSGSLLLSRMCLGIGNFDLTIWNRLVLNFCHSLLHQEHLSRRKDLVRDLIDLWKHVSKLRRVNHQEELPGFILPSVHEVQRSIEQPHKADASRHPHMHPTVKALTAIFPQLDPGQAQQIIPALLMTVATMLDPRHIELPAVVEAGPFLELVAAVLRSDVGKDESFLGHIFKDGVRFPAPKLTQLESYIDEHWPTVTETLGREGAVWRQGTNHPVASDSAAIEAIERLKVQLHKVHMDKKLNLGGLSFLWQEVQNLLRNQPNSATQLRNETEFFDEWIMVWCAKNRGEKVQETLAMMKQLQVQPTIRTYTNMMHGWKLCKAIDKVEALWTKLVASGMKLDTYIWVERISSLIENGKVQAGIQALAEMQALYKAAVERGVPKASVQPTAEIVNAALKCLISLDRKAAHEVLEWAGREQIDPNVRTYNILIRQSFRNDPPGDVWGLLKEMKKQGIDPDEATFTIILEEVIGSLINAPAAEQTEAVGYVLEEMAAAGLKPNALTYGKMLHVVARVVNGAEETINAILDRMLQDGLTMTPEMVTILIERVLQRDPSNVSAADELLQKHGFTNVTRGDQTLWERMVSAHAVAGDPAGALTIFHDLAQQGQPVRSQRCLLDLLRALISAGKLMEARGVVEVVLKHFGKNEQRLGERYWRHGFWCLAKEHGLVSSDEMRPLKR